ncbi:hypothetical protein [Longimicrobium sp.]|uniref:hypothetical protein n=1 Tax=Longimicrobium sp. TaxID=2029185 RepID=UPI002B849229|nr:hypothetical protein [Longimicrobium sp.]HSU17931.1 hypothetical protein [Longimicrobium sp.]
MRPLTLAALLLLLIVPATAAQRVVVTHGDVWFEPGHGRAARRLTTDGRTLQAALSPDARLVAYVRSTPGLPVETGSGTQEATELWTVAADGTRRTMRVRGHGARPVERIVAAMQDPQFSPGGRRIYFASAAWAVSAAVHVFDLDAGRERFVAPGWLAEVVQKGRYAGNLLVGQHRYFLAGGSYDWLYLLTPSGREIGPVQADAVPYDSTLADFRMDSGAGLMAPGTPGARPAGSAEPD